MYITKGDIAEKLAKSHFQIKTMLTIFFNIDGIQLIDIKLKGIKINADYFLNNIIKILEMNNIVTEGARNNENVFIHCEMHHVIMLVPLRLICNKADS